MCGAGVLCSATGTGSGVAWCWGHPVLGFRPLRAAACQACQLCWSGLNTLSKSLFVLHTLLSLATGLQLSTPAVAILCMACPVTFAPYAA
jgi:hypothetical protein